ncbi:unnamed protein product [Pleuronectes platessa]|uniref:PID domain-containing protein n=1 Tax=Pleuronectes platessa TaxID=8262 RepID=A0A9N7UQ13_PLEPL|nr:unnamed protein product [Pleuronectes platessa]
MGEAPVREDGAVTRSAEYVGSFPVDDRCLDDQMEQLHAQLKVLKVSADPNVQQETTCVPEVLHQRCENVHEDETTLLMAHALRRVSLSTAQPTDAQFAFVSHNPGSTDAQLYCHVFQARHARAAQFLNLLLCRCFQLSYLEKHPDEAQTDSEGSLPRRNPSLLNHGFPLSVSALVSFRRAPFQGLLPGIKTSSKSLDHAPSSPDDVFPTSSPSLVRKKAMRTKALCGAYRSFTFTPLKQRLVQERLSASQVLGDGDHSPSVVVSRGRFYHPHFSIEKRRKTRHQREGPRAPSLAETEEALAHAVWCWAGIATDSSYSLLADDVLGSYLLCPHPKKPKCGSLIIRFPSGLITHLIENSRTGKFLLEKCRTEFSSIAELIEFYTETREELPSLLSCARVNHCYEWEENTGKQPPVKLPKVFSIAKLKSSSRKWF